MPTWSGVPTPITRMLGQVDQDDPTNLPAGCAAVCLNADFTRDSTGGALSPSTRAGNNMTAQGALSPGTGLWDFQYEPESATDPFFQLLTRFTLSGVYEYESPSGSGHMRPIPAGMFTPPANSHRIDAQAGNILWSAYSNLLTPTAGCSGFNPKTKTIDPLGMKPYGFRWLPATYVYAGEVVTPSNQAAGPNGNGHTYQAQNSGWTAATTGNEPAWPTVEGGEVTENPVSAGQVAVVWKELTMVIANSIPAPAAPVLTLGSGGAFPSGQTVYIFLTMVNGMGETVAGGTASITTTGASQSVQVAIPALASLAGWMSQLQAPYAITGAHIYEADVVSGSGAPPQSTFEKVSYISFPLGSNQTVTATGGGGVAPTLNSARITPGQLPTPLTAPIIERTPAGSTVLPPGAPVLVLVNGGGTFANAQTVYVQLTLVNANGETTAGVINTITTTAVNQGVQVLLASTYGPTVTGVNVYEADYPSGHSPPVTYNLFNPSGPYALGASPIITNHNGGGVNPPANNTATLPNGSFPAGRDVYMRMSYSNSLGETPLGPSSEILNTLNEDAVLVTLEVVDNYPQIQTINIYEADVATGNVAPPISSFLLVGSYNYISTPQFFVLQSATGRAPVTVNGTGPGGNIVADTADGGVNATQGYRYAVPLWINRNETVSGFTAAAVSQYVVDEDGWSIAVFNVPLGPANVIGRAVAWSVADSTTEGPFWWIGLVDLQVPSQNLVYSKSYQSDGVEIIPTIFLDNVTTRGTFNFSDDYLEASNNVTDRLRLTAPPQATRIDYLKSCDRLALAGVPGYQSGLVFSLGEDYESYYGDNSPVPMVSTSGEKCWGAVEFRNQIYALRERSGMVVTPGEGDPNSWDVKERWSEVGPCGPRAFDACGQFIVFVHRSGLYKYDGNGAPDLMVKEIPRMWGWIDWSRAATICCTIDTDTHTVRLQVPVGPTNQNARREYCISYLEGWLDPIHFSSFKDIEISQEAARRWSFNDVDSYICKRIYRTIPNPPPLPLGPDGTSQTGSDFYVSQLAYTATDASGIINARTPGRYDDNGAGIDFKYQTISAKAMKKMCKPEGVVTSAVGFGALNVSLLAGRRRVTDNKGPMHEVKMAPMELTPDTGVDFSRRAARTSLDEYWGVLYDNGKVPGVWASIKSLIVYVIPVKSSRGAGVGGR